MLEDKLPEEDLDTLFKAFWPEFNAKLEAAGNAKPAEKRPRKERDLLEEILNIVRQLARADSERRESEARKKMLAADIQALEARLKEHESGPADLAEFADMLEAEAQRSKRRAAFSGASSNGATQPVSQPKISRVPQREK
jgi:hypothetical protein